MISKWNVKNFKSIQDQELELAPLTIFCGVNSSGKSSFLQTIGMLTQIARDGIVPKKVFLKGDLFDLGKYEHIFCKQAKAIDDSYEVEIGFTVSLHDDKEHISARIGLTELKEPEKEKNYNCGLKVISFKMIHHKEDNVDDAFIKWREIHQIGRSSGHSDDDIGNIETWALKIGRNGEPFEEQLTGSEPKLDSASLAEISSLTPKKLDNVIPDISFRNFRFLPGKVSFFWHSWDENEDTKNEHTIKFIDLITGLPQSELFTEKEANDYTANKITESGIPEDVIQHLLMLMANPEDDYNPNDEIWYERKLLDLKFNFKDMFSDFRETNANNKDTYKFNLTDWFKALSKLDCKEKEQIIENIKEETEKYNWLHCICYYLNEHYVHENTNFRENLFDLPFRLRTARDQIFSLFDSTEIDKPRIEYLCPLREKPRYEYKKNREKVKDSIGSDTAYNIYYAIEKNIKIQNYISPKYFKSTEDFDTSDKSIKMEDMNSIDAFNEWLSYISISDDIRPGKDEGKNDIFKLYMTIGSYQFEPPQLGTGVSQIIPILEKCLLSPPGSVIIIEQPESQMHPKIQSKLADFFIAMALSGRQCLIETHSEYIIEKLRHRIITMPGHIPLYKKTKFYFAEKTDGISFFKDMDFNEYAAPSEWPDGFFDESHKLANKTLDALIKKMKSRAKNE